MTYLDVTRPEGLFLVCPCCGLSRSVPPNWPAIWGTDTVQCTADGSVLLEVAR